MSGNRAQQAEAAADGVTIRGGWVERPLMVEAHVALNDAMVFKRVRIGRRSYMNDGVIRSDVTIGRYCSIGRRVTIGAPMHPVDWLSSHPFQFGSEFRPKGLMFGSKPTAIGNDVWIGDNVIVTEGVTIGDGAVVGGGSVVTRNVSSYKIVGGVPARLIRDRFSEDVVERLSALRWWELDEILLRKLPYNDPLACCDYLEALSDLDASRTVSEFREY